MYTHEHLHAMHRVIWYVCSVIPSPTYTIVLTGILNASILLVFLFPGLFLTSDYKVKSG